MACFLNFLYIKKSLYFSFLFIFVSFLSFFFLPHKNRSCVLPNQYSNLETEQKALLPARRDAGPAAAGGAGRILPGIFICGAADRSGRGKRSSSSSCWGGTIFQSPMYSFLGCDKAKTLSKKGCDKAKTLSKIQFSTPQISESIPFLFCYFVACFCAGKSVVVSSDLKKCMLCSPKREREREHLANR